MRLLPLALFASLTSLQAVEIVRLAVQQTEDGVVAGVDNPFVPGETVFVAANFAGFQVAKKKVLLEYKVEVFDPAGTPVVETLSGKVDAELHDEDKDWKPKIRQQIVIPPHAPGGTYRVRVVVNDGLSKSIATKETVFRVRGPVLEPATALVIRNFRFQRSDEDLPPLSPAAYRPGDTVWARFDITGFTLGAGNDMQVEYSVRVANEAGKVLFTQPEPTVEQGASFYPKRFVPCIINLALQANIATGKYTITVVATDKLGKQTTEAGGTFTIEK